MKNSDVLSTLYVGIDVSSRTNVVYAMDFGQEKIFSISVPNSRPGAEQLAERTRAAVDGSGFNKVVFAMESTSFYGTHLANFLSSSPENMGMNAYVYCVNPKSIANYRKSYVGLEKTDSRDAFLIADFARVGRITSSPWRGSQHLALQRLTRHRIHLARGMAREKQYMASNVFLKFSEIATMKKDDRPFASNYGATAEALLTECYSPEDIIDAPMEDLIAFLCQKSRGMIDDPVRTAEILKRAAKDSYRLDKSLYEPLNTAISSSFNCISAFEKELKAVGKAIEKLVMGLNANEYTCLRSIPGIGPVFAAGILAEICTVADFRSQDALAKYAGLFWKRRQSGDFNAEDVHVSKEGNAYLRYYLVEAAGSVSRHVPEYRDFYQKKYAEVKTHQHKRALALTARKLVRLIYGLLAKNQLFSPSKVGLTE